MQNPDLKAPGYFGWFSFPEVGGLKKPSRFLIDNLMNLERDLLGAGPPEGSTLRDSGVSIYWAPTQIKPTASRVVAYAFGLGKVSPTELDAQEPLILQRARELNR